LNNRRPSGGSARAATAASAASATANAVNRTQLEAALAPWTGELLPSGNS